MPDFSWEPLDFLEALEVLPDEEEFGMSTTYRVSRGPILLNLTIRPLDGDVALSLSCEGAAEPLLKLQLLGCPGARVVRDGRGTCIEFSAAKLFGGRYEHADAAPYGLRLQVQPYIQVTTFAYPV